MEAIDKTWVTLKTTPSTEIYEACEDAFINALMIGLVANPGLGKSSTFMRFKQANPNTYIIKLDKNFTSHDLYIAMLHGIGIYDWTDYTRNKALAEKFAYTIKSMDRPCLFIFDEAGLFSQDMLKYFHTIFDSTEGKLGIILAGTPVLKENIERWMKKNSGIAELHSRLLYWKQILSCKRTERQEVALKNGIADADLAKEISSSTQSFRDVYNKVMHHRIQVKRDRDPVKSNTTERPKLQKPKLL